MDYRDLPYDAEIEYLESTGTQWIDPDYNNGNSSIISLTAQLTSLTAQRRIIGNNSGYFEIYITGSINWGAASNGATTSSNITADTNVHIFRIDNVANKAYLDGSSWNITHNSASYYNKVCLFGRLNNTVGCAGRIYSAQIYEGSVLVRDLIPVRVGTTGYLFDRVSGQLFGNAGTGSFVLGPDVAPGRYANEIAFLESTGSQYIDTGIIADASLGYDFSYRLTTLQQHDMGAIESSDGSIKRNHITALYTNANKTLNICTNNTVTSIAQTDTSLHSISLRTTDTSKYSFDGVEHSITKVTQSINGNFFLFARNNVNITPSIGYAKMQLYEGKLYLGATLVRDFIPVEYNNIGYLYDKVSGEFFANQGTGKFVLGHRAPRFDGKACARSYTRRQLMAAQEYDYLEKGNLAANTLVSLDINPYNANWQFEGVIEKTGSVAPASETRMISSRLNNTSYRDIRITFTSNTVFAINVYTRGTYRTTWTVDSNKITFTADYNEATVNEITKSAGTKTGSVYSSAPALVLGDWSQQRCSMAFYSLKAKNNGTLVGDYAVCRRRKDGVIGIMNKVTNNFIVPSRGVITI